MQKHSTRPEGLHRGNSWQCKCREFNVYEALVCKAVAWDIDDAVEKRIRLEQIIHKNKKG